MNSTNRFTEKVEDAILQAQNRAQELGNAQIEPLHLLGALLAQAEGVAPAILRLANVNPEDLRRRVEGEIASMPRISGTGVQIHPSPTFRDVISRAQREAARMGDEYVSVEHLLLALADHSTT